MAVLLLERGDPGDGERAEELRASAVALAGELGLDELPERIDAVETGVAATGRES